MTKTLVILSYKMKSRALRHIRNAIEGRYRAFLYPGAEEEEAFQYTKNDVVFNWGNGYGLGSGPGVPKTIINSPQAVSFSVNKASMFEAFSEAGLYDIITRTLTSLKEAMEYLDDGECGGWVCRTELEGKDGAGIVVATRPQQMVLANLYVEYITCPREFRVHVERHGSSFVTEKVWDTKDHHDDLRIGNTFRMGAADPTSKPVVQCRDAAFRALEALDLDFAGVDVGWTGDRAVVFETNTAPGMFGPRTTQFYVDIINRAMKE